MNSRPFSSSVRLLLPLILILPLAGCVRRVEGHGPAATYAMNRGYDFLDIFGARVNGPKKAHAFGLYVRATAIAQLGAVYFDGVEAGMDRRATGMWRTRRVQGAIGPIAASRVEMRTMCGNDFAWWGHPWNQDRARGIVRNGEFWDDGRRQFTAFGVEIEPGILPGFELRFNPIEVLDFIAGFAMIDMHEDDLKTSYTKIVYDWENDPFRYKPATDYVEPKRDKDGNPIEPMDGLGTTMKGGKSSPLPIPGHEGAAPPATTEPAPDATPAVTPMPTPVWNVPDPAKEEFREPEAGGDDAGKADQDSGTVHKVKGPPDRHQENEQSSWWFSNFFKRNR